MRTVLKAVAMVMILTGPALVHAERVVIACGPENELEQCKKGAEAWARKTGHEVEVRPTGEKKEGESLPMDTSEQLKFVKKQFRDNPDEIDVYRVDVTWPGLLAEYFIDLKPYVSEEVLKQHFPAIVQNNTVGGRLVAMPWFIDAGLLYYRKDLLKKHHQSVPTTWEKLAEVAKTVQDAEHEAGNPQMWGFVFEAKKGEMLTCNALEWISSFGGGTLIDESGKVTINGSKNDSRAVEALKMATSWINKKISPPDLLQYD